MSACQVQRGGIKDRDQITPFPLGERTRTGFSKVETLVFLFLFFFPLQMTVLNHPWQQNLCSVKEAFGLGGGSGPEC